ncbi:kelch-like protein 10 [Clonorchis sinensis]|uniref:Kelch-like protein 10 n=1 Tax=Clonorchis sinensis TaxID=79923 RepID=G7YH29_CLOSI|nr:kelch-like protein 10 [Clonorchis sinensis]
MRRPTSDVRQRESRRPSLDNAGARRRNSSVPFHNARLERNPNSLDSDTDFLCDRAVEFMESGDIHSIVAVELAEQSMYFERLLRYHKGRGFIRLPEFLNSGFTSVLEFIRKGTTEITNENIYNIFIAADYLLVPKLKQDCANALKEVANDPATAIALWLNCRSLYWPEVGTMAFQKILENFENVWISSDFLQLDAMDVWLILKEDGLNCKREKNVFDAVLQWVTYAPKVRLPHALDLLLCVRLGMLTSVELNAIKHTELIRMLPDYMNILQDWPKCLTQTENPLIAACGRQFITPRLPHEVVMVFGGWCDGEGPRAAAQVYNPRANTWTLWTEAGAQAQQPALEWTELMKESGITDVTDMTSLTNAQPVPGLQSSVNSALQTVGALTALRSSLPPDGLDMPIDKDLSIMENTGSLIGEIPRRVYAGCVLIGTRVYLVGGFDGTNALKSTLCYDFEIDSGW